MGEKWPRELGISDKRGLVSEIACSVPCETNLGLGVRLTEPLELSGRDDFGAALLEFGAHYDALPPPLRRVKR